MKTRRVLSQRSPSRLAVGFRLFFDEVIQLLGLCTEVINFQCAYEFSYPALLPLLAEMRLRRLFVNLERLLDRDP
jgi:hypothetical protein